MELSERAMVLADRLGAFDSVFEVERFNFRTLEKIAVQTFESEDPLAFVDQRNSWLMEIAYHELQVAIFNYVSAAAALINQAMRGNKDPVKKGVYELFSIKNDEDRLLNYVSDHFVNDDVHCLVLGIQHACTHHRLPTHAVSLDFGQAIGRLTIPKQFLFDFGQVQQSLLPYIESLGEDIELFPLIRQHHSKVIALHNWIHTELARLWSEERAVLEADLEKERQTWSRFLQFNLEEALALEGAERFDRLHFFLSQVVRNDQRVELQPLEVLPDKRAWVAEAYESIRSRIRIEEDLDRRIRATYED